MERVKNTSGVMREVRVARPAAPQVTLANTRWTSRSARPRLVSLSWAGVASRLTER